MSQISATISVIAPFWRNGTRNRNQRALICAAIAVEFLSLFVACGFEAYRCSECEGGKDRIGQNEEKPCSKGSRNGEGTQAKVSAFMLFWLSGGRAQE